AEVVPARKAAVKLEAPPALGGAKEMFRQMLYAHHYAMLLLSLCALLAAGCSSAPTRRGHSEADEALTRSNLSSDSQIEKLSEAYAHYSTAVIHDFNNEPERAMEEYYKAAL